MAVASVVVVAAAATFGVYEQRVEGLTERAAHRTVDDKIDRARHERDEIEHVAERQVDRSIERLTTDDREEYEHAVNELAE